MYDIYSLEVINDKVKFYAKELWDLDFDIPIVINNRLKSTIGHFVGNKIELSNSYKTMNELMIDDLLLHEMCHWYCKKNK